MKAETKSVGTQPRSDPHAATHERLPLLRRWVSAADVQVALGCSRASAYEHLRRAAGRTPGAVDAGRLLRVGLEAWEAYAAATFSSSTPASPPPCPASSGASPTGTRSTSTPEVPVVVAPPAAGRTKSRRHLSGARSSSASPLPKTDPPPLAKTDPRRDRAAGSGSRSRRRVAIAVRAADARKPPSLGPIGRRSGGSSSRGGWRSQPPFCGARSEEPSMRTVWHW